MSLQESLGTFTPDNLFAGGIAPVVPGTETILTGQGVLARGTVLGKVVASGKCVIINSATQGATPGSGVVYAVLAETVDTTGGDVQAPVFYTGEYNENALVFGGTDDADDHRTAARNVGIFIKDTVSA